MEKLRLKTAAACFLFIAALTVPSVAHAADYDDKKLEQWTQENLTFQLAGGSAWKEVTALDSGAVNKKFSTLDEYFASSDEFSVAVSASMDGTTDSRLYWSQEKYKDEFGKSAHIAVLMSVSKSLSIDVGQKKKINVTCTKGTDKRYIKSITYKIKTPKIAGVKSSGYITGKKKGNTTVTAKVTLKSGLSKTFTTNLKVGK